MPVKTLLLAICAPLFVFGRNLDYIDADGVTDTGGPGKGRRLARTRPTGVLDPSLLPPLSEWASQPIPQLYFVSTAADAGGNGSVQYPFNSLTTAGTVASGATLVLAPGRYAGSLSFPDGKALSLVSAGAKALIPSLAVTTAGSTLDTELCLVGCTVGTLTVSGTGYLRIRLLGSTVTRLDGSSRHVTVTRMDLGADVRSYTLAHTDEYAGHRVAEAAKALAAADATPELTVGAGRAAVGTSALAYVDDLTGATNAVYVTIAALSAEDARLAGLIGAEATARQGADDALAGAIADALTDAKAYTDTLRDFWGTQLVGLSTGFRTVTNNVAQLDTREHDHYTNLVHRLEGVPTMGTLATLESRLRQSITQGDDNVRSAVTAVDTRVTGVVSTVSGHTASIAALEREVADKSASMDRRVGTNALAIAELKTWKAATASKLEDVKTHVNGILAALRLIKEGKADEITVPADITW